jgi:hypothetical protein
VRTVTEARPRARFERIQRRAAERGKATTQSSPRTANDRPRSQSTRPCQTLASVGYSTLVVRCAASRRRWTRPAHQPSDRWCR